MLVICIKFVLWCTNRWMSGLIWIFNNNCVSQYINMIYVVVLMQWNSHKFFDFSDRRSHKACSLISVAVFRYRFDTQCEKHGLEIGTLAFPCQLSPDDWYVLIHPSSKEWKMDRLVVVLSRSFVSTLHKNETATAQ